MKAYINGIGAITPQETLSKDQFLEHIEGMELPFLQILKLDYKEYINPKILRRMSKIIRMSIVAAQTALFDAGISVPEATITATGMGPQTDTEKFLGSVIDNDESLLNPTAFIQSTHNTMGAQIALLSGNNNYNLTYAQKSFSFENALLDALLLLQEEEVSNVLLGGIDEITQESWTISSKTGKYKASAVSNLEMLKDKQSGALAGEGATFLVLEDKESESTYARILGVKSLFNQSKDFNIFQAIKAFLLDQKMVINDIDLVLMGYNGDNLNDKVYSELEENHFANSTVGYYKHITGEYDTAVSFAVWLAAKIIKTGVVPDIIHKSGPARSGIKNILIYNHSRNIHHSLLLVSKA